MEIYIPTLHTFAMGNAFTGSCGALRFKAVPKVVKVEGSKEVDMEASSIFVEFWHGQFCYEKSTMEGQAAFPMSEEGRQSLIDFLKNQI